MIGPETPEQWMFAAVMLACVIGAACIVDRVDHWMTERKRTRMTLLSAASRSQPQTHRAQHESPIADKPTIGAELPHQRQVDFEADLAMARDPYSKPYTPTEAAMDSQPS